MHGNQEGEQEARVLAASWLRYYNEERLHTSLGYTTPQQYSQQTASVDAQALGALPPNPQDLPLCADPVDKKNEAEHIAPSPSTVFGPATALGALPSGALSSGRASINLPHQLLAPRPE